MSARSPIVALGLSALLAGGAFAETSGGAGVEPSERELAADRSGDGVTREQRAFWQMHWRRFAEKFALVDGEAYLCGRWDQKYPSSAHLSMSEWMARNTPTTRASAPPPEEALAAGTLLPALAPGQYGYIYSAKVERILGPGEMIVSDIWLVDAEAVAEAKEAEARRMLRINPHEAESARREASRRSLRESGLDERFDPFRLAERWDDPRLWNPATEQVERRQAARRPGGVRAIDRAARRAQVTGRAQVNREMLFRYGERERAAARQREFRGMRLRVIGVPTAGLSEGERWSEPDRRWGGLGLGPQIAIIEHDRSKHAGGDRRGGRFVGVARRQLLAVNGAEFRRGMGEERFAGLLAERGVSVAEFVRMARPLMREHRVEADPHILHALEEARHRSEEAVAAEGERSNGDGEGRASRSSSFEQWFREKYGEREEEASAAGEGDEAAGGEGAGDDAASADVADGEGPEAGGEPAPSRSGFEEWYRQRFGERAEEEGAAGDAADGGADGDESADDDPRSWFERKYGGAGDDDER